MSRIVLHTIIALFFTGMSYKARSQSATVRDKDGHIYSTKVLRDNRTWLTTNLNTNMPGTYCYDNKDCNCQQYGRLYNWQLAQEGCKLLGDGWRLPTNKEWEQMADYYGGLRDNSPDSGRTTYKALIKGGDAGFNVVLGGRRDGGADKYWRIEAHGFYWTATATDSAYAWFYNFGKNSGMMGRHKDGEKDMPLSVRCIKDATK
jgi:uncharacterized protein (TIGR02145 family)